MGKKSKKGRSGVVYSTNPDFDYRHDDEQEVEDLPASQQRLRVMLDRKQRKGKEVTLVDGFEGTDQTLQELGRILKQKCGVGGSVKDGQIILQGDHRTKVIDLLIKEGYSKTKKSGG